MSDDITKQIEEASRPLKPAFKEIVDSLAETNKEVALTAANFRSSNKNTFQGALAANKIRDSLNQVAEGLKTGEGQLGSIDFADFKKVNDELNSLEEARAKRLATAEKSTNVLGKMDSEILALKQKEIQGAKEGTLQGAALNNLVEKREAIEKERLKKAKEITKTFDDSIKTEKEKRDEFNKELDGILKQTTDETAQGLQSFSQGLKNLTGFDLIGAFDSVVENINSVGMLFGNQDLFGDVVGGIQNFTAGLKSGISSVSSGIMDGLKATGTYFSGLGETFQEGGLSAVTKQLNSDLASVWNSMKEGAGNLMDGIKKGWSAGVDTAKRGFMAFKAGTMNLLRGLGTFLASTVTFLTGLVVAGASLVASGVAMLAGVLGISSFALVLGLVGLLLIGAAIYLYNNSEGFRAAIDTVIGYFMDIIYTIGDIFGGFYNFFVGLFTGDFDLMFQGVKDIFGGLWDLMLAPFRAIGDFFKNVFGIDIGQILYDFARKVLPGWVLDWLGWGEGSDAPPPMNKSTPDNIEAIQRGSQQALTSEEIDNLSNEDQVKLGYAQVTSMSDDGEGGQNITYESTDKYQDVLRGEGVTSGGGFKGTATGSVAEDMLMADPTRAAELKAETQEVRSGEKQSMNQAVVTTVNNAPTQMSNTTIKTATPTPRDTDPTGSRLAAVPA